jgi:hypothetical protein
MGKWSHNVHPIPSDWLPSSDEDRRSDGPRDLQLRCVRRRDDAPSSEPGTLQRANPSETIRNLAFCQLSISHVISSANLVNRQLTWHSRGVIHFETKPVAQR